MMLEEPVPLPVPQSPHWHARPTAILGMHLCGRLRESPARDATLKLEFQNNVFKK